MFMCIVNLFVWCGATRTTEAPSSARRPIPSGARSVWEAHIGASTGTNIPTPEFAGRVGGCDRACSPYGPRSARGSVSAEGRCLSGVLEGRKVCAAMAMGRWLTILVARRSVACGGSCCIARLVKRALGRQPFSRAPIEWGVEVHPGIGLSVFVAKDFAHLKKLQNLLSFPT